MNVYEAIAAVMLDISKTGIGKDSTNEQQRYKFRGIDAVFNALSPLLAKHQLCIFPRVVQREFIERTTNAGKPLFYTTLTVEFDFVSAGDGSKHTVTMIGEAMDSADKSANKAMSAAYKYACFQTFAIPTEGDNDADTQTHDIQSRQAEDEARIKAEYTALTDKYLDTITAIKDGIAESRLSAACEAWEELDQDTKVALWKAPRNGGCFTTEERKVMKSTEFRQAYFGATAA